MEIFSTCQMAFLPLRYIFYNVLLTHETLVWVKESQKEVGYMKLYFSKAHVTISWEFMYQVMATIGIHNNFIEMTELFFCEASIVVNIKGQLLKSLDIQLGVRQKCPLAPNLFLIVREVLNHMVMKIMINQDIRGVRLPRVHNNKS